MRRDPRAAVGSSAVAALCAAWILLAPTGRGLAAEPPASLAFGVRAGWSNLDGAGKQYDDAFVEGFIDGVNDFYEKVADEI